MAEFLNPETQFVNTDGLFSLDELKALIQRLSLFISVDTGPIYIAEAFDVPTIDIIGPMDENEQPPRGEKTQDSKIGKQRKAGAAHNERH